MIAIISHGPCRWWNIQWSRRTAAPDCGRYGPPCGTILAGAILLAGSIVAATAGTVAAAPSRSNIIHLTVAQERALNIQSVALKTQKIHPMLTLYGELRKNPDSVWTVSSPLAGVVLNMPRKRWPQLGTAVVRGSSMARIQPMVSTSLQITLALELTKVKADLTAAKVTQSTATAAFSRAKTLYGQNNAVSLEQVQTAQAAMAAADARVRADVQSIAAISKQLKTKSGGFLPLPFLHNGTVTDILAHPGQAVAADQPLLKIEDFHMLLAAVALPATDSGTVALGAAVHVQALGHTHWLAAKPVTLGPKADRQTRGLSLLYLINNAGALRPGMAITAKVPKKAKAVAMVVIPRSAVIWWQGERWMYIARGGGVFAMRELMDPQAVPDGYAINDLSLRAARVVSQGAQLLLSMQLSSMLKKAG